MADLSYIQATTETKIVGQDASGNNVNYVGADTYGSIQSGLFGPTGVAITSASNGNAADQLLHIQTPDTTTPTTALGALNAVVNIAMAGLASAGFQLDAGTFIGTLTPQCSIDGGVTWINCSFYDPANSSILPSVTFTSSNTLTALSILPMGGASHVQVVVSAYTSGTANALMRASMVTGAAGAVTASAFGTVNNMSVALTKNAATQILVANPNRKYAYISNNSGSIITIQFGSSAGLTSTVNGLIIPYNSYYELKGNNLYTGVVYAFTSGNSITIAVTEGTP